MLPGDRRQHVLVAAGTVTGGLAALTWLAWRRRAAVPAPPAQQAPGEGTGDRLPQTVDQLACPGRLTRGEEALALVQGHLASAEVVEQVLLAGGLPPSLPDLGFLAHLTGLKALDLGANGLEQLPTGLFPRLSGLEVLNLAGNRLAELPEDVGSLRGLRRLGLKGNRLVSLPAGIGGLESLTELYLTDNLLEELPPEVGRLSRLVKLQASFNALRGLPEELTRLGRLELLRVACCRIEGLPPGLAQMPGLCWVSLAGNPVAGKAEAASARRRPSPPSVPFSALTLHHKLGDGASGEVYAASWGAPGAPRVAVKLFKGDISPDGRAADEESVACALADPCLTRVLGRVEQPHALVLALVDGQPLALKPDHTSLLRCRWDPGTRYCLAALLRIAHGVAAALQHMHAQGIAHGDVYAHNVLADAAGDPVLVDYGASFWYDGTRDGHFEAQEVQAYGLLLAGLLQQLDISFQGMEETLSLQKALLALVQACRNPAPAKRPSFAAIAARLRTFQRSSRVAGATSREEAAETLRSSRIVLSDRSSEGA